MPWYPFKARKKQEDPIKQERIKQNVFSLDFDSLPGQMLNAYNYGQHGGMKYNSDVFLAMYQTIPQLSSVINYIIDKASDVPFKHYKYQWNGKKRDLGETDVVKLLQNPNSKDSETSFRQDALLNLAIFGNVPIIKGNTPGFGTPTKLINEAANRIWRIPQYSIDQYGTPHQGVDVVENNVISYKKQLDNGALKPIRIEDMIYLSDMQPNKTGRDYYYGMSRIYAAIQTIDVMQNMYDSLNAILANKGALGFIKRNAKQGETDPMSYQDAIDEFEKDYLSKYGVKKGQRAIKATLADLSFERTTFPVSDFQPVELTGQQFDMLCNQIYGFPSLLLNRGDNSSYNNIITLERAFYSNTIKPINSLYFNGLSQGLGLTKNNEWLEADYSEIEALQENAKTKAETNKASFEYLSQMAEKGYITKNKVLLQMGFEQEGDPSFNTLTNEQPTADGANQSQQPAVN